MEKTTYVLGAGFSRYAGLPLMNDFYFRSKDIYPELTDETDKQSFKRVFDFFKDFSEVKNIMEADFYNIEELLSIIEMHAYLTGDKDIYKDYLHYLKRVIEITSPNKTTETGLFKIKDENLRTSHYFNFIRYIYGMERDANSNYYYRDKNNNNGIISLNYDLILENSLSPINKANSSFGDQPYYFNYGIDKGYIKDTMLQHRFYELNLAKIHGSINFSYNNGIPIIVPPTWNKTSNKEMQSVWEFAYKILSNSNNIVFIGYSLPETDLYVKYLLINGIKQCDNLKSIKVVCLDKDHKVEERYKRFFDINYRAKAFEFINKTFEGWMESYI